MDLSPRIVLPEHLDALDPQDPGAIESRGDLRRVHRAMRTVSIMKQAVKRLQLRQPPRRILELGGGDATLVLRLAQALRPRWPEVDLTVLDCHDIVSPRTRAAYGKIGWKLNVLRQDALRWATETDARHYDLCVTTLFLHHFDGDALARLVAAIAKRCDAFIACEPRRSVLALIGSQAIGLLGANRVTQEDAVTSVKAGFSGNELTVLWPVGEHRWSCEEYAAPPFTHCFTAVTHTPGSLRVLP